MCFYWCLRVFRHQRIATTRKQVGFYQRRWGFAWCCSFLSWTWQLLCKFRITFRRCAWGTILPLFQVSRTLGTRQRCTFLMGRWWYVCGTVRVGWGGVGWGGGANNVQVYFYTHTSCYATARSSCTCTHTSCYATARFSCTCTHTSCYATARSSCTCTHRSCYCTKSTSMKKIVPHALKNRNDNVINPRLWEYIYQFVYRHNQED